MPPNSNLDVIHEEAVDVMTLKLRLVMGTSESTLIPIGSVVEPWQCSGTIEHDGVLARALSSAW